MSGDWNPLDGGTPVNKAIDDGKEWADDQYEKAKDWTQENVLDKGNEFIDTITPDITMDAQKDIEEFVDYITPDITIGQEDQQWIKDTIGKGIDAYAGGKGTNPTTAMVTDAASYMSRKTGETPQINAIQAEENSLQKMLIPAAIGLGIFLLIFLKKKKKRS